MQEHKRVKHGEMPGEISRHSKIRMRESNQEFNIFSWQRITKTDIKALRVYLRNKGRTVQRRRDQRAIQHGMED